MRKRKQSTVLTESTIFVIIPLPVREQVFRVDILATYNKSQNPSNNKQKYILFSQFFGVARNSGLVAQLARAPALHAGGQEFKSPRVH